MVAETKSISSDGWVGNPNMLVDEEERFAGRFFTFGGFALARRIFFSGFLAVSLLFVGALFLSQIQNDVFDEKRDSVEVQINLVKELLEQKLIARGGERDTATLQALFQELQHYPAIDAYLYDPDLVEIDGKLSQIYETDAGRALINIEDGESVGFFRSILAFLSQFGARLGPRDAEAFRNLVAVQIENGDEGLMTATTQQGLSLLGGGRRIFADGEVVGSIVLVVPPGLVERMSSQERNGIVGLFLVALLLTGILSHMVARSISEPLHDLATAAELGKSAQIGQEEASRVLVPDLVGRHDAVGRLSAAMGDMINALYDRIDTNERFAADVVHEIKNPLASMRSAVETLRVAKEGPGRSELLNILEHDVQRLDRMVSDISNASRLDSELVNQETERFDLTLMLRRICEFHSMEANDEGIDLIWEEPAKPIQFDGLEERLAQVFVNLVTNAISFCKTGDAVRVWARIRSNRILVVVEDTGPGIPEEALQKIFHRFYSQRPEKSFGNHSGLGLAISKQIIEAHGGVIWAENIIDPEDRHGESSLGARFIVGLPR